MIKELLLYMAKMWRYTFGMWKGEDERKIVVLESVLRVLWDGVVFLDW